MARFRVVLSGAVTAALIISLFVVPGSFAEPLGAGLLQHFGVTSGNPGGGQTEALINSVGLPVTVGNTSNNPVPVTVQGTNSQPLTATINGTVNTNATVQGTVSTQDVNDPTAQPFQYNWQFTIDDSTIAGDANAQSIDVPAGKRLILRYVSGIMRLGPNQTGFIEIETTGGLAVVAHDVPPASVSTIGTETVVMCGLETWIAADAGTTIYLYAELDGNAPSARRTGKVAISGYLVDMPTTP